MLGNENKTAYLEAANTGRNQVWIYFIVLFIMILFTLIVQAILLAFAFLIEGNLDILMYPPLTLLWVTMLPFAMALFTLLFGVHFFHKRSLWTVISPQKKFRWSIFGAAGGLWFILSVVGDLILSMFQPGNYQFSIDLSAVLSYFLLALGLIAIQITAEEFLFRGYLMQAFGRLWKNIIFVVIMQALFFGLLHGANTEVSEYGLLTTMPFYIGIAVLLGLFTIKTNGLEAALGVHFFNNLYATSFVTFAGSSVTSPALFKIQEYNPVASLIVFFCIMVVFSILFFRILKKIKFEKSENENSDDKKLTGL